MKMRNTIVCGLAIGVAGATAAADRTFELVDVITGESSGWEVTIFDEEFVDIVVDAVSLDGGVVVIEKFAEFTALGSVLIDFRQIADDADTVSRIVITDERVINNTGSDWNEFAFRLLGSDAAAFNADQSASFDISPFTTRTYADGNRELTLGGGILGDGATWTPGLADGGLVIDVDLGGADPVAFTLEENAIPTPGVLAIAGLGGLLAARRRR